MAAVPGGGKNSLLVQPFRLKFCLYVVKQKTDRNGKRRVIRGFIFFWKVFHRENRLPRWSAARGTEWAGFPGKRKTALPGPDANSGNRNLSLF